MNLIQLKSQSNRRKKLLIADMDSTILRSETLDDLAISIGKIEQIKNITKDAMDGKINFIGSLKERVRVLKDTNEKHLVQIKNNLKYNPGAKELISTMKKASRLMIIGNSDKGEQTTDHYSMMGFTKAYNSAKKSCS